MEIGLRNVTLEPNRADTPPDLTPGNYVRLAVRDTGCGISSESIGRIFDPYFTTKAKGEGTGLGLTVVHGIVKSHNGAVSVSSEVGKGTVFHIFLPQFKHEHTVHEASREVHLPTGHETVLFVEDELAIAHMCKEMLEMLGYKVIICANGIEALELFKINPNMYDLVITDMTMPKMNGSELAKKLMSIRADIPIIMCTGYSHNISEEKAKSEGIRELIIKPYDSWDIALTIRNVLDRPDQEGRYSR